MCQYLLLSAGPCHLEVFLCNFNEFVYKGNCNKLIMKYHKCYGKSKVSPITHYETPRPHDVCFEKTFFNCTYISALTISLCLFISMISCKLRIIVSRAASSDIRRISIIFWHTLFPLPKWSTNFSCDKISSISRWEAFLRVKRKVKNIIHA